MDFVLVLMLEKKLGETVCKILYFRKEQNIDLPAIVVTRPLFCSRVSPPSLDAIHLRLQARKLFRSGKKKDHVNTNRKTLILHECVSRLVP